MHKLMHIILSCLLLLPLLAGCVDVDAEDEPDYDDDDAVYYEVEEDDDDTVYYHEDDDDATTVYYEMDDDDVEVEKVEEGEEIEVEYDDGEVEIDD